MPEAFPGTCSTSLYAGSPGSGNQNRRGSGRTTQQQKWACFSNSSLHITSSCTSTPPSSFISYHLLFPAPHPPLCFFLTSGPFPHQCYSGFKAVTIWSLGSNNYNQHVSSKKHHHSQQVTFEYSFLPPTLNSSQVFQIRQD